jgi:hypothetical protein
MVIFQRSPLLKANELYRYRVRVILHVYETLAYKVTRLNFGSIYAYSSVFCRGLWDRSLKQSADFFPVLVCLPFIITFINLEAKSSVVQKSVFESVICFTYCHAF